MFFNISWCHGAGMAKKWCDSVEVILVTARPVVVNDRPVTGVWQLSCQTSPTPELLTVITYKLKRNEELQEIIQHSTTTHKRHISPHIADVNRLMSFNKTLRTTRISSCQIHWARPTASSVSSECVLCIPSLYHPYPLTVSSVSSSHCSSILSRSFLDSYWTTAILKQSPRTLTKVLQWSVKGTNHTRQWQHRISATSHCILLNILTLCIFFTVLSHTFLLSKAEKEGLAIRAKSIH